jgi:hypothetical protein
MNGTTTVAVAAYMSFIASNSMLVHFGQKGHLVLLQRGLSHTPFEYVSLTIGSSSDVCASRTWTPQLTCADARVEAGIRQTKHLSVLALSVVAQVPMCADLAMAFHELQARLARVHIHEGGNSEEVKTSPKHPHPISEAGRSSALSPILAGDRPDRCNMA